MCLRDLERGLFLQNGAVAAGIALPRADAQSLKKGSRDAGARYDVTAAEKYFEGRILEVWKRDLQVQP